ncbi:hypothetical protein ACP8HI_17150 [Paenibacillus sp. FA6]|uniref:hypothetical protein n=1 Tax=Paenibacillus sp. FA6 TaxID=3413029 RepID=UPI003F658174
MKKYVISISIGVILIALVVFSIYSQAQLHRVPIEYSYDIETEDFYIKDINFVAYHNSLYVAGNYYLEMIGEDNQFDGVSFECSVDGISIMSVAQADDPFQLPDAMGERKYYFDHGFLLEKMKISKRDILEWEIKYKVNGETKEVHGEVKLKDVVKPFSSTGSRKPIRL